MNAIQDFISTATKQFGASEAGTRNATRGLLQLIQDKSDSADYTELLDKVPGARELVQDSEEGAGGSGMLGGLLGSVGGGLTSKIGLGNKLGSAAGLVGMFAKSGISGGGVQGFVSMFMQFVTTHAGSSLTDRLLKAAPNLSKLIK